MISWDQAIEDWATAMAAAGRSKATIRLYRCHIGKIARAVPEGVEHVTLHDLQAILACDKWMPETRKSVRSTFTMFFRWAHGTGLIDEDPAVRLPPISVPAGVARPAPDDIITQARVEADDRTRAMILLAAYAGLRCSEIAKVHSDHWDGQGLYITGKGGRTRYVPIVRADLKEILCEADGWLFPGQIDGHISAGYVSKLLSRALPGAWTGHTLRHRCATAMYDGTRDLLAVGAILGHTKPETTQRYVRLPHDSLMAAATAAA